MRILSFSLLTALTNAAADVQHNPSLRGRIDSNGEEADWFHRMAQDIGSMVPTQAPVVSPPGPGFTTAPVATPPPTMDPTPPPTKAPTNAETKSPTKAPTKSPTKAPTKSPTKEPTKSPTNNPLTSAPTVSLSPTALASDGPSSVPTIAVSLSPTALASDGPSSVPTITSFDLDFVQDESDGDFFFDVCQGDCDSDADCRLGLVCFFREAGTPDVPGCDGNADLINQGDDDFCIRPPTPNTLVVRGDDTNDGIQFPAGAFPLGECEGDCDSDDDCGAGLKCFSRDGDEAVPGCVGFGADTFDYCYERSDTDLEVVDGFEDFSLDQCQGDCDQDADCRYGLICFQRGFLVGSVPGCKGDANFLGFGDDDFCIPPPTPDTLVIVGDEAVPASAFPMGACQGDCDTNADCIGALICWERQGDEDVPGCIGDGQAGYDYCSIGPPFEGLELSSDEIIQTGQSQDDGDELPPSRGYNVPAENTVSDSPFATFLYAKANGSGP